MKTESQPQSQDWLGHFGVWFGIIFCLKWRTLSEPPVWDSVVGLFPAASTLADTGFNLRELLQQPIFLHGGSNTHAESVVTWLIAILFWLFGKGPSTLVLLHVLNFALAAWTLSKLFRLAVQFMDRIVAWMLCAVVLFCPLFHVQAGAIYLEIPMALCTVSAVAAYSNGQLGRALFWGALATWIKQPGIIVLGALSAAALLRSGPLFQRFRQAATFAILGLLIVSLPLLESPLMGNLSGYSGTKWNGLWDWFQRRPLFYLKTIPDVFGVCVVFALGGLFRFRDILISLKGLSDLDLIPVGDQRSPQCETTSAIRTPCAVGVSWVLLLMFFLLYFVVPFVTQLYILALPRYAVSIFPCVLLGMVYGLSTWTSARVTKVALGVLMLFFLVNRNGDFYPAYRGNDLSVHERSGAYRQLVDQQRAAMRTVSRLPDDATIYYGLLEYFMMQHPWMGYAERQHPGGRCVAMTQEQPKSTTREDLPSNFFVVLDRRGFWGERFLKSLLQDADADPTRQVLHYRRFQQGQFVVDIYEVRPAAE
ncbi:MAG: hypothetical protein IAG10_08365 [Planctomycetaceae bacterium]|nr:hypothetical protein [Planctomycetaceae bacterium]